VANHARGTFEVKIVPQDDKDWEPTIGRMSIDKKFSGDIVGTSKGQMLAAMTEVKGSAGYVALERVVGGLHGRTGTFVLQHDGTMNRGAATLRVAVVPDSGTGDLSGLTGTLTIDIVNGKHLYDFTYSLPDSAA
jgi:hypothetical protein